MCAVIEFTCPKNGKSTDVTQAQRTHSALGMAQWITYTDSQGKLEKNLEQIPYQNIFVPRSCIRSGLATQNLFTLDIHRRIFRMVKSKMAEDLTEIT